MIIFVNLAEPQNALILDFFVPKGTKVVIALRELFKKNDFGDLAAPFYERISDKNFTNRCKDKLKYLLNHCKNLQMGMMRRPLPPSMMGPPIRPPTGFMGPPRPLGPDPNLRIQLLELELMSLKRKTLMDIRPLGGGNRGGNRGGNANGSGPQRQGQQNRKGNQQRQNVKQSPQKPPQNNVNPPAANNGMQQQQNRSQGNRPNTNNRNNNNNAANNRRNQNNQQQNNQQGANRRNAPNFNRSNQQDNNMSMRNQSANNQNFGGQNRQNMGQNRAQQNQGRVAQRNFNNARGGQNQLMSANFNDQQGYNDFSDDFIPPPSKRNRFDNNAGQQLMSNFRGGNTNFGGRNQSFDDDFDDFRPLNNFNDFGGLNRGNSNGSLFERRANLDNFSSMGGGGANFSNQSNFGGGQGNFGSRSGGNLLERPAFMAGSQNRNNFNANRRGNFGNF